MVESLINYWTTHHFFFGLGVSIVIVLLLNRKHPNYTITLFILVLWEMFEYREFRSYWIINYLNNIMDVIVGFIAVIIVNLLFDKIKSK